ncbi:hypothetical protein EFP50_11895 [Lacticaseibacillus paracasei]|nr:hypothetical protein [Lacticaseibacillus paracasei]QEM98323.1 hypothetical protein D0638_10660 [Lacticaseibacillus paracasei]
MKECFAREGSETREQAQKPAHKDPKPKWPKPSHLGLRPLMLRFLTAPVHALLLQRRISDKML